MSEKTYNEISIKSVIEGSSILIVGLAWNTTVKEIIERSFPDKKNTIKGFLIYAICITILVIIIIGSYNNFCRHKEKLLSPFSSRNKGENNIKKDKIN